MSVGAGTPSLSRSSAEALRGVLMANLYDVGVTELEAHLSATTGDVVITMIADGHEVVAHWTPAVLDGEGEMMRDAWRACEAAVVAVMDPTLWWLREMGETV